MANVGSLFTNYAVNISDTEVQMIDNRVVIKKGGWKGLTAREVDHEDVIYALRKGWIKLSATEPKTEEDPAKVEVKLSKPSDFSGKTLEEVKAEKAEKKK